MKIGELAQRASLNASAIRYYEKLGLLAPPHRSGGQRWYSPDALDRVLLILFAGEMGFSLPEIKLFLSGLRDDTPVGPRWKKLETKKSPSSKPASLEGSASKLSSRVFSAAAALPSSNASRPSA